MRLNNFCKIIIGVWLCLSFVATTVIITSPLLTPFADNKLNYSYANFGQVPYGKSISYDLVYVDNNLCKNITELKHFQKPTYVVINASNTFECSFTTRAFNAQLIGAKGVIFGSNVATFATGGVVLADDGNGRTIHITCLFID